ncbi:hypothetical protein [Paenibacillus campi]|uniref:hypothetical protein n=1 Tax=Paenibacillus campi TaxID=3106031 RepID=UPI002AFE9831|nr:MULTISPECIES: hypothetical protein [unclassified Paenibacillus]
MEYYKLRFEESNENYYFEVDDERTVLRQVIEDEERWVVSCRPDEELHFCLFDQVFDQSMEDAEGRDVTAEQFEDVWAAATQRYRKSWERTKQRFAPGDQVSGIVEVFYPQGTILSLPSDAYGILADRECNGSVTVAGRAPGYMLKAYVIGWDEINMWLKLSCMKPHAMK